MFSTESPFSLFLKGTSYYRTSLCKLGECLIEESHWKFFNWSNDASLASPIYNWYLVVYYCLLLFVAGNEDCNPQSSALALTRGLRVDEVHYLVGCLCSCRNGVGER
uniref:Putative ovule protein n=1 Tax=Solanum chacoense TaxID=4108 RepID=A0A0V0GS10_SOLCH